MIAGLLFIVIGTWLNAPVSYYFVCGLYMFVILMKYGLAMYNAGRKK